MINIFSYILHIIYYVRICAFRLRVHPYNLHSCINVCIMKIIQSRHFTSSYKKYDWIIFFMHMFMQLCKFVWIYLRLASHGWKFTAKQNSNILADHNRRKESRVMSAELWLIALFCSAVNFHSWYASPSPDLQ